MVTGFLFPFTQVTPIWHVLAPSFELINGQDSVPRRFPSKKAYSHWSPRPPNNTSRKRVTRGSCEGAVERSNRKKAILANLPAQDILHISIQNQRMQFSEQTLHLFHFPIIKVFWKQRIPATHLPALLPSIKHLLILVDRQSESIRENFFQRLVLTPQILPKFGLPPISYDKTGSTPNIFPSFSNNFPHPHTIASPHFSRIPTCSLYPKFGYDDLFPQRIPLYRKSLAPLPK